MSIRIKLLPKNKWLRAAAGVFIILILLLSLLPAFISLDRFRPEIAALISEAIEQPVTLGRLRMQLLPFPRLQVYDVRAGETVAVGVTIQRLDVYPRLHALLDAEVDIRHIHLHQVDVSTGFIDAMTALAESSAAQTEQPITLRLGKISLSQVRVKQDAKTSYGPYAGEIKFSKQLTVINATVVREDNRAQLMITPGPTAIGLRLQAHDWQLPVVPRWKFNRLTAEAVLSDKHLSVKMLQAELYDGKVDTQAEISWQQDWQIKGTADVSGLAVEPLLAPLLDKPVLAGYLTGTGSYILQAATASELGSLPTVNAELIVNDGIIYNADLEKATRLLNQGGVKGGQTPFALLSGLLSMHQGNITVKNLVVKSDVIDANGDITIDAKQMVDGEIEVGVSRTGSLVSMPIQISGPLEDPDLRPTNAAIVGGAVGTGLLGPGLGTAVGVKASKVIDKVGDFFNNIVPAPSEVDEDEDEVEQFSSDDSEE